MLLRERIDDMTKEVKDKRGQFYIIAAFIIVAIIIGFVSLTSYAGDKTGESAVYDLGKELGVESGEVIDHGIYHTEDRTEILNIIQKFADDYVKYAEGKLDAERWYFVYWDESGLPPEIFIYSVEPIIIANGIVESTQQQIGRRFVGKGKLDNAFRRQVGDTFIYTITIFGEEREVPLKEGIGLYFLIREKRGEEEHVVEGKN